MNNSLKVTTYSDGGARGNPGPAACGMLVIGERGEVVAEFKDYLGLTTNNVAEYCGILGCLKLAHKAGAQEVDAYLDSELVVRQLTGVYRIREEHLRKLYDQVKKEEKNFLKVTYNHVPRTHPRIKHVDKLVNQALDEVPGT
ncbi:MAG: ribonuclease HI family protein [Candidatus Omnitrophica bacterium]|nr:ribonuclease HI family protein [Candidatus Omnitrophota bacterium]